MTLPLSQLEPAEKEIRRMETLCGSNMISVPFPGPPKAEELQFAAQAARWQLCATS
jgi:hypothetical protein